MPKVENLNVWMMWRNEKTIHTMRDWISLETISYDGKRDKKWYLSLLEVTTPKVWIPWRKETRIHTMKVELVEEWDKKEGLDFLERSIIVDFTTPGRSEHLWPSLSLFKLIGPHGLILCFNVPISSPKISCLYIYASFKAITMCIHRFWPQTRVHWEVCKMTNVFGVFLIWVWITWLLAFQIPWEHSN